MGIEGSNPSFSATSQTPYRKAVWGFSLINFCRKDALENIQFILSECKLELVNMTYIQSSIGVF